MDKGGTKSGGFFNLFDWNRKSRKKLFSSGSVSPENTKFEKRSQDNLLSARLRLVNDDEIVGISSRKGSSDFSCASSMTDEEGITLRAPGVVARLMGLDSMPTAGVFEPNSTPFFDSRSLRDKQSHKQSPEFYMNDQFDHAVHRVDGYARRPMEPRSQKMPSSPIERFQTETLPPKSARSLPITHHKLLSPIKNPGFISAKNAASIMEAAAKILDPRGQPNTRSSSIPLRVHGSKENMVVSQSQRAYRILEPARTPVDSNYFRHLKGQSSNRSRNGLEDDAVLRCSRDTRDGFSADVKGKGKSVSLAIQAKVNVQRREGLNSSPRNSLVQKEHDVYSFNQSSKSQPSNQKNKQQKKSSATNTSGVLRQNNQKQNCISSKGKLSLKPSMSNQQHGRKVLAVDSSSTKNKSSNKIYGNLKYAHAEKEESLSSKDFPRKKRLIERSFISNKIGFTDDVLVDRHQKRIQPNVVIDEHSFLRRKEDNRSDGADVVSFTFTSPLIKPISVSRFSTQVVENLDNGNMHCFDTHNQKKIDDVNDKKLTSHGLNLISGDDLSLLLEQKLRELTGGFQPSCGSILKSGSSAAFSSISQEPLSDFDAIDIATVEHEELQHDSPRDRPGSVFGYGVSSTNGEMHGTINLQEVEECSSSSDARTEFDIQLTSPFSIPEASLSNESCNLTESSDRSDGKDQYHIYNLTESPFSIPEASLSNESCNLTESSDRSDGSKTCSSSIQAQCNASFSSVSKTLSTETETELSDSASSTITETSDELGLSNSNCIKASNHDFNYVREILFNATLASKDTLVDPVLFDKLEDKRRDKDKNGWLKRKVLFDCVNECLEFKCSKCFRSGYRAWSKAELVFGKESLADEIHDEILKWKCMGDLMVDELVDEDMSSHLGKWLDYEIEAFEEGLQIEREIVDSLVEEVITDCLMKGPCL